MSGFGWLADILLGEGKKIVKKKVAKEGILNELAYYFMVGQVPSAKQPKAKQLVDEIAQTHELLHSGATADALVKTVANATVYPKEMIQAALNYTYKRILTGDPPSTESNNTTSVELPKSSIQNPDEHLQQWGWKFGIELIATKIAKLALTAGPGILTYYTVMGKFPFADQNLVKQVQESILDVEKKIQRKFSDEAIPMNEPQLREIATKLIVFSYMYPTETAQSVLDYAVNNITEITYATVREEMASGKVREDRMPGSWIQSGGGRRRVIQVVRSRYGAKRTVSRKKKSKTRSRQRKTSRYRR